MADWLLMTLGVGVISCLLVLAGAIPGQLAGPLVVFPALFGWARLIRAGASRRAVIAAQLPILVDLMALEQSGGELAPGARWSSW